MTINLHAVTDFGKGDVGQVTGHRVTKVDRAGRAEGLVVALQDVKAGHQRVVREEVTRTSHTVASVMDRDATSADDQQSAA